MRKNIIILFFLFACSLVIQSNINAQEFPITTGNLVKSPGGIAFDGANYLIGIVGDNVNSKSITAQFLSPTGSLVGSRISLGVTGATPFVAFDGTNYLMLWSNYSGSSGDNKVTDTVFGQFISTAGTLVGTHFPIFIDASISSPKGGYLVFGDSNYLIVYKQNAINYLQKLNKQGNLIGSPVQLSNMEVNDNAIGFDGTNYLVAWAVHNSEFDNQEDIYGQFISKSGALVGSNFIIDDGSFASDNPLSIAFDGSRYLVAFHESSTIGWNLFARFVTPLGNVEQNRIMLRDSTYSPSFPFMTFDGTNYLVVFSDSAFSTESVIKGRFFNTQGVPIDDDFTIFSTINSMIPFYGVPVFNTNNFLVFTYRMNPQLNNGDISAKFIPLSTQGLVDINTSDNLFEAYPNPASNLLNIKIESINNSDLTLSIYNIMGIIVKQELISNNQQQINIEDLVSGVYLLEIRSKYWNKTQKLIIRK